MSLKIKRSPCRVSIIIPEYRIEGTIHLHPLMRFTDFFNAAPEFIPVTDAKIFTVYANELKEQISLLEIRRDQIILIYPEEARPVLEEIEGTIESQEDYPEKPLEPVIIDLTKSQ